MCKSILIPENLKSLFLFKTKKKENDFYIKGKIGWIVDDSILKLEALKWYTSSADGEIGKYSFETKSLWKSLRFNNSDFIKLHKKGVLERIDKGVYRFIK